MKTALEVVAVVLMVAVVGGQQREDNFLQDAMSLLEKCGTAHVSLCMKERALNYLDQLPTEVDFGGGLKIKQTTRGDEPSARSSRFFNVAALPRDSEAREKSLDSILLDRVLNYFSSHIFEFKMPQDTVLEIKRSLQESEDEARKKKKKKGMSIASLLYMKAAMLGALALKAIGIIAFKAFVMAKIALAIASIIALKKLLEQKHTSSSYEVVAHPYEDHGHYDRSFDIDLPSVGVGAGFSRAADASLPYRAHDNKLLSNF